MMPEPNENKIEEKAKGLGRAIGQTDSAKAMDRAQESLEDNEETRELFETVQRMEQDVIQKLQRGEDVDEDKREELRETMQKLESRPAFQKYISAQQNLENLMKQVNEYIQEGIHPS